MATRKPTATPQLQDAPTELQVQAWQSQHKVLFTAEALDDDGQVVLAIFHRPNRDQLNEFMAEHALGHRAEAGHKLLVHCGLFFSPHLGERNEDNDTYSLLCLQAYAEYLPYMSSRLPQKKTYDLSLTSQA